MRLASSGGRRASAAALEAKKYAMDPERVISRKELAEAARDAMKALKLPPAMRYVLAEMVGCWGEKLVADKCMVWPSNDYLVERTGLSERSVRYGIRGLVERKLVTPKDSANGKRFAIKKDGVISDAFGFDLSPLYARRGEWAEKLMELQTERDRIRRLYDEITICRRAAEEALDALRADFQEHWRPELGEKLQEVNGRIPNRRAGSSESVLGAILDEVRALRSSAEEAFYNAANDGSHCRHIETTNESPQESSLSKPSKEVEDGENPSPKRALPGLKLILEACPAAAEYSPHDIASEADLVAAGRYIRGALGAHESAWNEAAELLGPVRAAIVVVITLQLHVDDVASGKNHIKNPGGYFRALMRLVATGRMNLQTELLTMSRRRQM